MHLKGGAHNNRKKEEEEALRFLVMTRPTTTTNIVDLMVSWASPTDGQPGGRADLTIMGEPRAQQGWRVRWRNLPFPRIFDPLAREKGKVWRMLQGALEEFGFAPWHVPLFRNAEELRVSICFFHSPGHPKDLDNMAKFLLDSLEGAAYDNDKHIVDLHLVKSTLNSPKTIITISTASI